MSRCWIPGLFPGEPWCRWLLGKRRLALGFSKVFLVVFIYSKWFILLCNWLMSSFFIFFHVHFDFHRVLSQNQNLWYQSMIWLNMFICYFKTSMVVWWWRWRERGRVWWCIPLALYRKDLSFLIVFVFPCPRLPKVYRKSQSLSRKQKKHSLQILQVLSFRFDQKNDDVSISSKGVVALRPLRWRRLCQNH